MSEWWNHYLRGLIIRRPETPQSIISAMEDWHDGPKSAMHMFAHDKPVNPRILMKEITYCLAESRTDEQAAQLQALRLWALREERLAEATKAFRVARRAFHEAANAVDLDPYVASRIATMEA